LSRILVYLAFILLCSAIGFMIAVPPELQPAFQEGRRLSTFLTALQTDPKSIYSVALTNGQSVVKFRMQDKVEQEQTTVIPIEWKGMLVQQMIDKQIPFTVRDTDYTWAIAAFVAAVALGYFRLILLPRWAQRTCPNCAERVHCSARVCRYCESELLPVSLEFGKTEEEEEESDEEILEEGLDGTEAAELQNEPRSVENDEDPATIGQADETKTAGANSR
jgi:hypothetical protein